MGREQREQSEFRGRQGCGAAAGRPHRREGTHELFGVRAKDPQVGMAAQDLVDLTEQDPRPEGSASAT